MGQKVHPGGFRVGVIHDWKSNWWTGKAEFSEYLLEDVRIRKHILRKLSHAGLSDILIRKDKQRITIDIYTARPGIVIGKSGVEVDALRRRLGVFASGRSASTSVTWQVRLRIRLTRPRARGFQRFSVGPSSA